MARARTLVIVAALLISCAPPVSAPSPTGTAVEPPPSRTPSLAPTSNPTAAPSPTGDPSRYGVLLQAPSRIFVRRERPLTDVILAVGGEQPAASHDGKRIAFWRTGPQGNNPQELRIAEIIRSSVARSGC